MGNIASPLRYPGGKSGLTDFLGQVIKVNKMRDPVYAEPYAGGAGAALSLLFSEKVSHIVLNDKDRCIYAFWRAILNQTKQFLDLLESTAVTIDEWQNQREIYQSPSRYGQLRLGFATFYLNRCNRSGILVNGGPIGGFDQQSKWQIGARFNKSALREKIEKISLYRDRIEIHNLDALDLLRMVIRPIACKQNLCLVYLDPPYYEKGKNLYLNAYSNIDHAVLARFLKRTRFFNWILTYDNVPQIYEMYTNYAPKSFNLCYSAYKRRTGHELLIHDPRLLLPDKLPGISCAA
jgi:DNA adenine methylase